MSAGTAGLAPAFKAKVDALVAASHGAVTVVSGYRTFQDQVGLRRANGCPDIMKSPASSCTVRPTAIPGTSQHEKGLAVDFGGDTTLASRLAPQFGLVRTVGDDPNHYEAAGGAIPGVAQTGGGATQGVVNAVAAVGSSPVDGLLSGLQKIVLNGLFMAVGLGLLAAGAYRATTGRSITTAAAKIGGAALTDGASAAPRSAP